METRLIVNLGVIRSIVLLFNSIRHLIALTEKTWGLDRAKSETWRKMVTILP